jgi:hypothetical protein
MRHTLVIAVCFFAAALAGSVDSVQAQNSRPFDDYRPPSSVSPYLNLINNNNSSSTDANLFMNYQLFVKPQLEQRRINSQSATAIKHLQQQQKQQARAPKPESGPEGNKKLRSTGHLVTRANYSHYYQPLNRQQAP